MRIINYLWNLSDISSALDRTRDGVNYSEGVADSSPEFDSFFNEYCGLSNYKDSKFKQYDSILNILIKKLFNRWLNNDHIYLVATEPKELKKDDIYKVMRKVLDKVDYTVPIYAKLIEVKEKYLENIKDTVETRSESISKHNDTPNADNDYSADKFTSDISKSEATSSTDIDSVERYKQVKDLIENTYQMWLNEFEEFEIWMD